VGCVAWVSRHPPLPVQIDALKSKLGDVEIVQISRTFTDVNEIVGEVRRVGAKHAVVVLPLSMIARLLEVCRDVVWLQAEMVPVHEHSCEGENCSDFNPKTDVVLSSPNFTRHLRFNGFKVIKKIEMITEPF